MSAAHLHLILNHAPLFGLFGSLGLVSAVARRDDPIGRGVLVLLVGFRTRALPRALTGSVLVLAVAAGGWIGYVANLGGKIHHSEIRDSRAVPADVRGPAAHDDH